MRDNWIEGTLVTFVIQVCAPPLKTVCAQSAYLHKWWRRGLA